jgi:O-antigen polymerase
MKTSIDILLIIFFSILLMITPLIISNEILVGVMTMKYIYFNVIQTLIIAGGIFYWLNLRQAQFFLTQIDIVFTLFLGYCIIHYYSSQRPESLKFIAFSGMLPLYWVIKQTVANHKDNRSIIIAIISVILLIADIQIIWIYLQWSGKLNSFNMYHLVTGSFSNPSPMSIYLSLHLPLALTLFLYIPKPDNKIELSAKILAFITIISICIILPITKSRTSWIIAILGIGLVIFFLPKVRKYIYSFIDSPTKQLSFVSVFIAMVILVGITLYNFKKDSADGRLLIWKVGLSMTKGNLLFGKGFDAVPREYDKYQASYFASGNATSNEIALADQLGSVFNDYIHIMVEFGLLGLCLFLYLFIILIKHYFKDKTIIEQGFTVSAILFFIAALFTYPLQTLPILLLFVVYIAIASGMEHGQRLYLFAFNLNSLKNLSLIISTFWFINVMKEQIRFYRAFEFAYDGIVWHLGKENYKQSLVSYEKSLAELPLNGWIMMQYGKALAQTKQHKKSIEVLTKAKEMITDTSLYRSLGDSYCYFKNYDEAEKCYRLAINIVPNKFSTRSHLANLYLMKHDTVQAKKVALEILNMPVKIPSKRITSIKKEMKNIIDLPASNNKTSFNDE